MENNPVINIDQTARKSMSTAYTLGQNYFSSELTFISDYREIKKDMLFNQTFRSKEPRLMYIQKGSTVHNINLKNYELKEGMLLITPINCLFSIVSMSDDFTPLVMACDYNLADTGIVYDLHLMMLPEAERHLVETYFALANKVISEKNHHEKALKYLFLSLMHFGLDFYSNMESIVMEKKKKSASEVIKEHFMRLVLEEGGVRHDLKYYAEKLNVTPNYLSIAVKKESASTVAQWCNQRLVLEAQMLLRSPRNLTLSEIADMLGFNNNSQFGTFFKKETGMTPGEYRNSQAV